MSLLPSEFEKFRDGFLMGCAASGMIGTVTLVEGVDRQHQPGIVSLRAECDGRVTREVVHIEEIWAGQGDPADLGLLFAVRAACRLAGVEDA